MILAKTKKGKFIPEIEDKQGWHGMPYYDTVYLENMKKNIKFPDLELIPRKPIGEEWPVDEPEF